MALPTLDELLYGDLFELLGIEDANQQIKDQLVQKMVTIINARVVERIAEALSDEEARSFKTIAEEGTPQQLADYLVEKNVDLPQIVSQEATRYRVETVELIRQLQEKSNG